jgi:hypothetical protein
MKRTLATAVAGLCASAALLPSCADAQTPDSWQLSESWRFGATLYGYFPTIGLKSTLPSGVSSDISVSPKTILDHLKMGFFGALEAQKGRWGAFTDVLYVNVGGAPTNTRDFRLVGGPLPAQVSASTSIDLKAFVWTLGGGYRAVANPEATLDVFAGARLLDLKQTQSWQLTGNIGPIPLPGRSGSGDVSVSNWDAIIGVKGRFAVDAERTWFVPYYLDVGTGESKLTWQALGGIGYSFSWGDVVATWRYLDYRNQSGKPIQDLNLSGPLLAFAFHW